MKKINMLLVFCVFLLPATAFGAQAKQKTFTGNGAVTTVSPMFPRISIKHGTIKDFAGAGKTEFAVSSKDLITDIHSGDMVSFEIVDNQGDVKISKITKTGVAVPDEEGIPVGKAAQGVLEETGRVVNGITQPLEPINQIANSAMGATTSTTGSVLNDASPDVKKKF